MCTDVCHKSKGKGKKGKSLSSAQARSSMSADLFAVMVLHNFYLHALIHYYFTASHLIYFTIVFVCRTLQALDTDRMPFLGLCMMRANRWPERGRHGRRFPRSPRSHTLERPSRRLPRSQRSEWPRRSLPRSQTLRTRLVTSHRSPIG
jgi:hypothetical protein